MCTTLSMSFVNVSAITTVLLNLNANIVIINVHSVVCCRAAMAITLNTIIITSVGFPFYIDTIYGYDKHSSFMNSHWNCFPNFTFIKVFPL